jgi:hypothetical protein
MVVIDVFIPIVDADPIQHWEFDFFGLFIVWKRLLPRTAEHWILCEVVTR